MGNQVFRCLGLKNPNGNDEHKNEAKTRERQLTECLAENFYIGRMPRDDLKALEEVETKWRPQKEIYDESVEELTAGEIKQPHMTDKEPQHTRRGSVVTEVLKPKAYEPKSEVENAAPIDEMMLPRSKEALEAVAGVQTGDVGIKGGMPISEDLTEAKFQKSAISARYVRRGCLRWLWKVGMFNWECA